MSTKLLIISLILVGSIFPACNSAAPEVVQCQTEPECTPSLQKIETVQEQKTEIQQPGKVEFKGVSFTYNPEVSGEIKSEEITEEFPLESESDKPGDNFPRHLSFSSDMKQPKPEKVGQKPRTMTIRVIPINDYRRMFAVSKNATEWFDEQFEGLRKVILNKNFRNKREVENGYLEEMPFMYTYDASQAFQKKVKQISFENGKGIFFLTQFLHDTEYVNNEDLDYIFQGITDDGKYLIVAEFPASVSFLPDGYMAREFEGYYIPDNFYGSEYKSNYKRYKQYLSNVGEKLEKLSSEKYEPNLKYFEEIISSLKIGNEVSGK